MHHLFRSAGSSPADQLTSCCERLGSTYGASYVRCWRVKTSPLTHSPKGSADGVGRATSSPDSLFVESRTLGPIGCTACAGLGRGRFGPSMGTLGRPAVRRAPPKARACLNRGPLCAMAVGGVGPTVGRMRAPRIGRGHRTARRHSCPPQKCPEMSLDPRPSTCAGALPRQL